MPVGLICRSSFCFSEYANYPISTPSRPTKGALRNVNNAGRDAVDANGAFKTWAPDADGQVVWFWHLDAGVKFAEATPQATETNKPELRGDHEAAVKTIRVRECRVSPVDSW